jgi:murein L,D-transpeptidase YcbB/YkuD
MERWRWLPRELGHRAVVVNTAGFLLEVVERERPVLTMRIVVGKPFTRTPIFHAAITSVLLNPAWNIPGSIARKELLPLIRKHPSYLAKHHITVLRGWGPQTKALDPRSVNWTTLSARHFLYRLRQEPGPHNALGQVKFNLPNPFSVYLHDTPARELFTKSMRAFSHGCIRIEKPLELAEYLLRDSQQWTHERLLLAIEQGEQQTVTLPYPVPVYVGYWTAWVDRDQQVYFVRDLYGRDAALGK